MKSEGAQETRRCSSENSRASSRKLSTFRDSEGGHDIQNGPRVTTSTPDPGGDPASGNPDASRRRRPKHDRTNTDIAGMVERMVRALRNRGLADRDPEVLRSLIALRAQIDQAVADMVTELRGHPSAHSWAELGALLGLSKSAAQERYRKAGGVRRRGGQEGIYR